MDSGAAVTWAWIITLAVIGALIAVDLLFSRRVGGGGLRAAAVLSGLWVAAGLAFGAVRGCGGGRMPPVSTWPATCWRRR